MKFTDKSKAVITGQLSIETIDRLYSEATIVEKELRLLMIDDNNNEVVSPEIKKAHYAIIKDHSIVFDVLGRRLIRSHRLDPIEPSIVVDVKLL